MLEETTRRLRWRCRRGILELDLLLEAFLESSYSILSDKEKRVFETILCYPDSELWGYCFEENLHPDPLIADVIANIRRTALP